MASGTDSRGHFPESKWAFDKSVTDVFEDMLSRSIPQYDVMREITADIACAYARDHTDVIDIGCSRGEALFQVRESIRAKTGRANTSYVGVELSRPMYESARQRFSGDTDVEILLEDLRSFSISSYSPSLVLSVLTLQFVPINHRSRILEDIYTNLLPGGALILVEKVLGSTSGLDAMLIARYHDLKKSQGYSLEEVERKSASLEGVLVPLTSGVNETWLRNAGFDGVECYWRYLNFTGWVAVKRS